MKSNKTNEFIDYIQNIPSKNINMMNHSHFSHKFTSIVGKFNLILMFFGTISNMVCVRVFVKKSMFKKRFNKYLFAHSLVDILFCLLTFLNYLVYILYEEKNFSDLHKISCFFHDYILNLLDALSVYLAVILSIDRLYTIKKPIKIKNFLTYKYPVGVIFIGFIIIALASIPIVILNPRAYVSVKPQDDLVQEYGSESYVDAIHNDYNIDQVKNAIEKSNKTVFSNELEFEYLFKPSSKKYDFYIPSNDLQPFCKFITIHDVDHISYRQAFEIFYHIIFSFLFNFFPAFLIFVLNCYLIQFLIRYSDTNSSINGLRRHSGNIFRLVENRISENQFLSNNITISHNIKRKNSYFATIIALGLWLIISNIPYYGFTIWEWTMHLLESDYFKGDVNIILQAIWSVLFNSNHCILIFVYIAFHHAFLLNLKAMFKVSFLDSNQNLARSRNLTLSNFTTGSNLCLNKIDNVFELNKNNQEHILDETVCSCQRRNSCFTPQRKTNFSKSENMLFVDEYSEEGF
jgi:hypothetical protein